MQTFVIMFKRLDVCDSIMLKQHFYEICYIVTLIIQTKLNKLNQTKKNNNNKVLCSNAGPVTIVARIKLNASIKDKN